MHQAVEQGNVGARFVLQEQVGIVGDINATGIGHDELGPTVPHRLPDLGSDDRVLLGGIAADDKEALALLGDIADGVGHRAAAKACHQTGDGGAVSEASTVVDGIGGQDLPRELVKEIVLLVGALGRSQHGKSIAAMFLFDLGEAVGYQVQRGIPVGFDKIIRIGSWGLGIRHSPLTAGQSLLHTGQPLGPHQRPGQAVGVVYVVVAVAAFDTERQTVDRRILSSW